MPAIPAMRPKRPITITALRPIRMPPANEVQGVKAVAVSSSIRVSLCRVRFGRQYIAMAGKAIRTATASACIPMKGRSERKMSPRLMSGGATDLR